MSEEREARWYVIHTYSGYEDKVKRSLENIVTGQNLQSVIQEVSVPVDKTVETRDGKRYETEHKRYQGYVFLKLVYGYDDEGDKKLWYLIRNTQGVTGFVGTNPNKPLPMTDSDLIAMGLVEPEKVEVDYDVGSLVRITDGPFRDNKAVVKEINKDKQQVTVEVSLFGRETPLTLDFINVRKI